MTRYDQVRLDVFRQLGGFVPEQISGNTPFRRPPIDGKKSDIDLERPQFF